MNMSNTLLTRPRTWWLTRQRLAGPAPRTIADCARACGWLPNGGGAGVYLSIRARMPRVTRDAIDRAIVDATPLMEVPGGHARGSVIAPREEAALALRLAQLSSDKHLAPQFRKGTISEAALDSLGTAICHVLAECPLRTTDLRQAVSFSHAQSLDLFQAALARLSIRGAVRRFSGEGRIDSPKYLYELVHPDDRPDAAREGDLPAVAARLAAIFLRRNGPATREDVTWWTGFTKTEVRDALEAIGAERLSIPGWAKETWLLTEDRAAWEAADARADDRVLMLPFRDPFIYSRRPPAVLTDDGSATVLDWKAKPTRVGDVDTLHHHAIVYRDVVVGVWEYDPDAEEIVTRIWGEKRGLTRRVEEAAADTSQFIREQLGDAKFYAADTATSREPRIAFCRRS
jgi:hypothetical protein